MELKNRLMIALAVIVLIVGAMFASFGRNLFVLNTPPVVLPDPEHAGTAGDASGGGPSSVNHLQTVAVTPKTVQDVIANTLTRSDSYYRELTVETFWAEDSASVLVQTWVSGGWTHSRQALPSGAIRHDLVGVKRLYYWYEGSDQWQSLPADSLSSDLSQRLPTYETVLALDPRDITAAGYELRGEQSCIYVEVTSGPERTERYWIDVDSGLLTCAEMERSGQLVYRMTAYSPQPCPANASFLLPDGSEPEG